MINLLTGFGHDIQSVLNGGYGCSEYSFIKLVKKFSETQEISFFDSKKKNIKTQKNIIHKNINQATDFIKDQDIVICDRAYNYLQNNPNIFRAKKVFNIIHDYLGVKKHVVRLLNKYPNYFPVFVSQTQMEAFSIPNKNCNFVYNLFMKEVTDSSEKQNITYASAPRKGLHQIYKILKPILSENLKLNVCYPCYCNPKMDNIVNDSHTIIYNNLQYKEYISLISNSKYIISPPKFETFGCVFAEASFLNTNTLYFSSSGAVKEICPQSINLGNYKNLDEVRHKILHLMSKKENEKIYMNTQLQEKEIMNKWNRLINE